MKNHPEDQVELLVRSIKEYGWTTPVLVDSQNNVIAGHGRLIAAERMGISDVPVLRLEHLTPVQARAYRIADNRLTELGGWDMDLLAQELAELKNLDFDLDLTGFDQGEISRITKDLMPEEEEKERLPPPDPETAIGDLYILGDHRLICGDSTDPETVARVLDGEKPNLMVTDPPYGVDYDPDWRNETYRSNGKPVGAQATKRVLNDHQADWSSAYGLFPGAVVYVWHAMGALSVEFYRTITESGFEIRSQIIWAKSNAPIGRGHYHFKHEPCWYGVRKGASADWIGDRKQTTVWEIDKPQKSETGHATQKPLECMERPIRNHSGDVYEPFAGSGTTIIAAERQNRRCFAIELDPGYCDVIVKRWEEYTGKIAARE